MNENINHSREYINARKKKDRIVKQEVDKLAEKRSFELLCQEFDTLIKDKRYAGYKFLLETRLQNSRLRRDKLLNTVKSSDEYVRLGLILDSEISVLSEILEIPDKFANRLKELQGREGGTDA